MALSSHVARDICDTYTLEFQYVLIEVREVPRHHCQNGDFYAAWDLWSKEAEAGLMRVYGKAGSASLSGTPGRPGRGKLR